MADDLISTNLSENIDSLSLGSKELLTNDTTSEEHPIVVSQNLSSFKYGMDNKHRGIAVIFNHYDFNDNNIPPRYGTEADVQNLNKCLPYLGFQKQHIIVENDLTKSEILQYSKKLVKEKEDILKNSDCIAIFILSHGHRGNLIDARDESYELYELVEQFTAKKFPLLTTKPKLFVIQACRGTKKDNEVDEKEVSKYLQQDTGEIPKTGKFSDPGLWQLDLQPHNADVFIGHSSYHEHISFRNPLSGSWYIQDLCYAIRKYSDHGLLETTDITELLTYTNFLTSRRTTGMSYMKQCPTYNSGLLRKLCFKTQTIKTKQV